MKGKTKFNLSLTCINVILIVAITFSCKKYKEEFYGPPMGIAPSDFTASPLIASDANPNFLTGSIYFSSEFNATVRWKLTLVGKNSKAIKVFTGVDKSIGPSNTTWDGSTDTTRLFRKDEQVEATLSVFGWKDTLRTTITIAQEKNRGIVLGTFENITVNQASQNFQDATGLWWFFSFDSPAEKDTVGRYTDPHAPQGMHVIKFAGKDVNQSYYIGKVGLSSPGPVFNFGTTDPDKLYFNLYVKGAGTDLSASGKPKDYKFVIETFEDDEGNGLQYNNTEDKFSYTISLNYDGWRLHRIKYKSFALDPGSTASPKTYSPDKIGNIGFYIGANTSAGLSATDVVQTAIDYFTVTNNGPMIP